MWASPVDIEKFGIRDGDLLVCEGGEGGRAGIVLNPPRDCIIQNALHRVRAKPTASVKFLQHVLSTVSSSGWFDVLCDKATIAHFTREKFAALMILVPPRDEQDAIVAFLDRKLAEVDRFIALKRRLIDLLNEQKATLINQAVTRGLDPNGEMKLSGLQVVERCPIQWTIKRLKYIVLPGEYGIQMGPFGGMIKDLDTFNSGYKVYGQENTISGDFQRGSRYINSARYKELQRYSIKPEDLLLTRKGSIGNARLFPSDAQLGIIDSDTIRVRAKTDEVANEYLLLLMHSAWYLQEQLQENRRGAVVAGLNTSTIGNLVLLLPPLNEQLVILESLQCSLDELQQLENKANHEIELIEEYRTALIAEAVTGKIDVRER
jgi:type I restriction enzyme S subunit